MLILDAQSQPVDRVEPFLWWRVTKERSATVIRLFGRLVAYLPETHCAHYAWSVALSYRAMQRVSVDQLAPPYVRVALLSRWEVGLVLGCWLTGLRLRQPVVWVRRLLPA